MPDKIRYCRCEERTSKRERDENEDEDAGPLQVLAVPHVLVQVVSEVASLSSKVINQSINPSIIHSIHSSKYSLARGD
jgi:hypothetical protein